MFSFVDKALALSSCMASVVLGLVQKVSIFDVSAIAFSLFFLFWQPDADQSRLQVLPGDSRFSLYPPVFQFLFHFLQFFSNVYRNFQELLRL